MRYAHIDEAGTSEREKFVSVAGIVSHADTQRRPITAYLQRLRDELPEELGLDEVIFHAKDIWHGNKDFDRERWERCGVGRDERRGLVQKLCEVPGKFDLPVVCGFVEKAAHHWHGIEEAGLKNINPNRANYALAFAMCCISIEKVVRECTPEDEVAQIVAENTNEMREHAHWAFDLLSNSDTPWDLNNWHRQYLPLERICEVPQFTEKHQSSILQVADALAFVFNRHLTKGSRSDVLSCFEAFEDRIVLPADFYDLRYDDD